MTIPNIGSLDPGTYATYLLCLELDKARHDMQLVAKHPEPREVA